MSPGDNPVYSEYAHSWEQCLAMCFLASAIFAFFAPFCALYLALLSSIFLLSSTDLALTLLLTNQIAILMVRSCVG